MRLDKVVQLSLFERSVVVPVQADRNGGCGQFAVMNVNIQFQRVAVRNQADMLIRAGLAHQMGMTLATATEKQDAG